MVEKRPIHIVKPEGKVMPDAINSQEFEKLVQQQLAKFKNKQVQMSRYLLPSDRRMVLLNHSMFTRYTDAVNLGLGPAAQTILENKPSRLQDKDQT